MLVLSIVHKRSCLKNVLYFRHLEMWCNFPFKKFTFTIGILDLTIYSYCTGKGVTKKSLKMIDHSLAITEKSDKNKKVLISNKRLSINNKTTQIKTKPFSKQIKAIKGTYFPFKESYSYYINI